MTLKAAELPLIKENNSERILRIITAFDTYPLDREAQREEVLSLYQDKEEKSVFRGMVIPSLRKLGIIQGWEDMIFLGGNGRIIAEATKESPATGLRVFRAVLLEQDRLLLSVVEKELRKPTTLGRLEGRLSQLVVAPSSRQASERIKRWVALLTSAGLVKKDSGELVSDSTALKIAQADLSVKISQKEFVDLLFAGYRVAVGKQRGVDVVDIAELRGEVSVIVWRNLHAVLTEAGFDDLLRITPRISKTYLISFGKPMGPEEKLFRFENQFYRTMSIRNL